MPKKAGWPIGLMVFVPMAAIFLVAIIVDVALFLLAPDLLATWLIPKLGNPIAGAFLLLFLLYIVGSVIYTLRWQRQLKQSDTDKAK